MADIVKDKFKVNKVEIGKFEYDTIFIEVNKNVVQIPIEKTVLHGKQIVGKTILIPCELNGEDYIFNRIIEKVEFI